VLVAEHRVTDLAVPPTTYRVLTERHAPALASLRRVTLVGEQAAQLPDVPRTADFVAGYRVAEYAGSTHGARFLLLDEQLRPVPRCVPGDLYVAGPAVAEGCPEDRTAGSTLLVADPFGPPGARMVRTGDRARRTADGELRILAVPGESEPPEPGLPPLTPEGRLDRAALAAARRSAQEARRTQAARAGDGAQPRADGLEERILSLFTEVLGGTAVNAQDNFFRVGGHSLLAVRLLNRIRGELGADLALRDVFQAPSAAGLAGLIRTATPAADAKAAAGPQAPAPERPTLRRRTRGGTVLAAVITAAAAAAAKEA